MKKNLLLFAACLSFFISCKKDADIPLQAININFSKSALGYVQIPVNRYFIYKDSATGNTDSIIVAESSIRTLSVAEVAANYNTLSPAQPKYAYQFFTLLLSNVKGSGSTDWFYGTASANIFSYSNISSSDSAVLWLSEIDKPTGNNKAYVFQYPFAPGKLIASLNIEGKNYADVVVTSANNGITPSNPYYTSYYFACTYYWAKGIGIIKRSISTSAGTQTWTLLRHG